MIITVQSTNNKWYGCRGARVARRQLPVFYCSVTWVITFTLTAHTNPGPAAQDHRISLFLSFANGYKAATLLRLRDCVWQVWHAVMLWLIMKSMCLPGQCLHTVFILLLPYHGCLLLLLLWCCGVAGAGVVFVRVNNWWKVSPPRVSRVMGTFIAAFINLHITITTEGRLLFHVISAEKEKIIGLPKKQGCWCKTIWF